MNTASSAVLEPLSSQSPVSTVMVATDFLQSSRLALDYAAAFAHRFNAKLVIVNAFELTAIAQTVEEVDRVQSRTRLNAEARLKAFAASVTATGVPTKWALVEGLVPNAIIDATQKYHADMLVIGTQGVHRGLSHLLIGSNTEVLMQKAKCPTVTIGPHVMGGVGKEVQFSRVVFISDHAPCCVPSTLHALSLCNALAEKVELLQFATPEVADDRTRASQLAQQFADCMQSHQPEGRWNDESYRLGRLITPQQMNALSTDPAILMVLGVKPESYLGRHIRTCTAYKLLANAACPILTLRDA